MRAVDLRNPPQKQDISIIKICPIFIVDNNSICERVTDMGKWKFNPFGGLFDFNRNGKADPWELWISHQIIKDTIKDESDI